MLLQGTKVSRLNSNILLVIFKESVSNLYHFRWHINVFTVIMVKIQVDQMKTNKMKVR